MTEMTFNVEKQDGKFVLRFDSAETSILNDELFDSLESCFLVVCNCVKNGIILKLFRGNGHHWFVVYDENQKPVWRSGEYDSSYICKDNADHFLESIKILREKEHLSIGFY